MNQIILVGRLTKDPEVITTETDKKRTVITLAVSRPYKNIDGIYEADFIPCVLWNNIALNTSEYCHTGDVIGIKGRLQTRTYQDNENNNKSIMEVIAEKVTFLSTNKNLEKEN